MVIHSTPCQRFSEKNDSGLLPDHICTQNTESRKMENSHPWENLHSGIGLEGYMWTLDIE